MNNMAHRWMVLAAVLVLTSCSFGGIPFLMLEPNVPVQGESDAGSSDMIDNTLPPWMATYQNGGQLDLNDDGEDRVTISVSGQSKTIVLESPDIRAIWQYDGEMISSRMVDNYGAGRYDDATSYSYGDTTQQRIEVQDLDNDGLYDIRVSTTDDYSVGSTTILTERAINTMGRQGEFAIDSINEISIYREACIGDTGSQAHPECSPKLSGWTPTHNIAHDKLDPPDDYSAPGSIGCDPDSILETENCSRWKASSVMPVPGTSIAILVNDSSHSDPIYSGWRCDRDFASAVLVPAIRMAWGPGMACLGAIAPTVKTALQQFMSKPTMTDDVGNKYAWLIDCNIPCSLGDGAVAMTLEKTMRKASNAQGGAAGFSTVSARTHINVTDIQGSSRPVADYILHEMMHLTEGAHADSCGTWRQDGDGRGRAEGIQTDQFWACGDFCGGCQSGLFKLKSHPDMTGAGSLAAACARCAAPGKRGSCGFQTAHDVPNYYWPSDAIDPVMVHDDEVVSSTDPVDVETWISYQDALGIRGTDDPHIYTPPTDDGHPAYYLISLETATYASCDDHFLHDSWVHALVTDGQAKAAMPACASRTTAPGGEQTEECKQIVATMPDGNKCEHPDDVWNAHDICLNRSHGP